MRPLLLWMSACCLPMAAPDESPSEMPDGAEAEPEEEPDLVPRHPPSELLYESLPDGDAASSAWEPGDVLYAAVHESNIRAAPSTDADAVGQLRLGDEVMVLEVGEAVDLIGRHLPWFHVRAQTGDGTVEGYAFGSLLTPVVFDADLDGDGTLDKVALTFGPDFKPRVRVVSEGGEAVALDVALGSEGGTLTGEVLAHPSQDWSVVKLTLCPGAACETAVVSYRTTRKGPALDLVATGEAPLTVEPVGDGLVVGTQAFEMRGGKLDPSERKPLRPPGGSTDAVSFRPWSEPKLFRYYTLRGTEMDEGGQEYAWENTIEYMGFGRIEDGEYAGKTLISHVETDFDSKMGNAHTTIHRFVAVEKKEWLLVASASDPGLDPQYLIAQAAEHDITIGVEPTLVIEGLSVPPVLHDDDRGQIKLVDSRDAPPKDDDGLVEAFSHPTVGTVLGDSDILRVTQADGATLYYRYEPPVKTTHHWAAPVLEGASIAWREGHTGKGSYPVQYGGMCGERARGPAKAAVTREELEVVGDSEGVVLYAPKDRGHPLYDTLLAEVDDRAAAFGDGPPVLLFEDSFGWFRTLPRSDLFETLMCEPVLYLYGDPHTTVQVTLGDDVDVFRAAPPGSGTWSLHPSPDGRVVDAHTGVEAPFLFWEGVRRHIRRPPFGTEVAGADSEAWLREVLPAHGLRGREIDDFVDAWAPDLERSSCSVVAFHSPRSVEREVPMVIEPAPDTLIRVLMDSWPCDGLWLSPQPTWPVPRREGFVVVEWGGLRRPGELR